MSRLKQINSSENDISESNIINILLIGETGVGKSTFCNALINYLYYDSLDDALKSEMQILIPGSFVVSDPETLEDVTIRIGESNSNESEETGQSATQSSRSYLFKLGRRAIRFIDGPGIGDCRGPDVERKNLQNILNYISIFPHLNGICLLLKSSISRLNIFVRYCLKELLHHLHVDCKENIMFIFTGSRMNFFKPGGGAPLIRALLKEIADNNKVTIPFNISNTFLFDNEGFRMLAMRKQNPDILADEIDQFKLSWKQSVKALTNLIERIIKCRLHDTKSTVSLNEAIQQTQIAFRPLAETARIVQENIVLANEYEQKFIKSCEDPLLENFQQRTGKFVKLPFNVTACTNGTCTNVVNFNGLASINYETVCHEDCFLEGVVQECIGHPFLKECAAMDGTDYCTKCKCHWSKHIHITYRFETTTNNVSFKSDDKETGPGSILKMIEERITHLRNEDEKIRKTCIQLTRFIRENSLVPFNDDSIEYIRLYLDEEKKKIDRNPAIIARFEQMINEYETFTTIFQKSSSENDDMIDLSKQNQGDESNRVLSLIEELYHLPIHGHIIKQQMEKLLRGRQTHGTRFETVIDLTDQKNGTSALFELRKIINA